MHRYAHPFVFVFALLLAAMAASAQIIIDTDSGTFKDDGVAVAMMLRSPRRTEVQGITVVPGNVWTRRGVTYMQRNVKLLGLPNLPVLGGAEAPLVHTVEMTRREQPIRFAGAFADSLPTNDAPRGAVDFLIRAIDAAPGHVTILAIGPLTNLAIALRLRPDIAPKISGLVMMGGNVHVPGNASRSAEFNFWFDPEAAQIVLRSEIPNKVLFALDVCNHALFTRQLFDRVVAAQSPLIDVYREDFGNRYPAFLKKPEAQGYLWDELAAAYVIDPTLLTRSETLYLDVDSTFGPSYGAVKPLDRDLAPRATPVKVALDMDFPRLHDIYVQALTAP